MKVHYATPPATAEEVGGRVRTRIVPRINPVTALAIAAVVVLLLVGAFGPAIAPFDPLQTNARNALKGPSWAHWAGTDQLGRDVFSRLIVATRLDLIIAFSAVALSSVFGIIIGGFVGYFGGWSDRITGRLVDVLMAFPLFVMTMALVAAFGNSMMNVIYATAIINLPFYIRLARAEVNARRELGWVSAARLAGSSHSRVVLCVLLPNILPIVVVQVSLNLGWAILNAAGLSFLGLGVRPPTPEWGVMVAEGARYVTAGKWWLVAFPGLALVVTVLSFNLLGDALRDALDPRGRR